MPRSSLLLLALASLLLVRCANTQLDPPVCEGGSIRCVGNTTLKCAADGRSWQVESDCSTKALICTTQGCKTCQPGARLCQGQSYVSCNADGMGFSKPILSCDGTKGLICDVSSEGGGGCSNACELARVNRSYVGCEYWAVDLDNAVVDIGSAAAQQFAVVLSNPSTLTAKVTVSINEAPLGQPAQVTVVTTRDVKPGQLEVVLLGPREVDGSPPGEFNTGTHTALTPNAFKIVSTAPIIAYQFNPLENVSVFSNDASLLIPTSALTTDSTTTHGASYAVMGWPQTIATTTDPKTNFGVDLRAFLTIVGTREQTQVRVKLTTDILGDGKTIPAKKRGEILDVTLQPYDVLNLETGGYLADFTGSRIEADKPVVVFSGSEASDAPAVPDLTTRRCCADHLEEQLLPIPTLGKTFVALTTQSRTQAVKDAGAVITAHPETEYFRILTSGEFAGISTTLAPPDDNFTVGGNKFAQLTTDKDFIIHGTEPLVVGQFMASQEVSGIPSSLPGGDPSFILLAPIEQYRKDYLFLTPDKYAFDFIAVAAPREARVKLDGRLLVDGLVAGPGPKLKCSKTPVGRVLRPGDKTETDIAAYKCQLSFPVIIPDQTPPKNLLRGEQNDGVHRLTGDQPFGLVVYGFDAYVSYGYLGGSDLALINLK